MKRVVALILAAVMAVFALVSCGGGEPSVTDPEITNPEITNPEITEPDITEPDITEPEETAPDVAEQKADYEHVVIIGVDGAGTFFKKADTPNLDAIFENGAVTYKMQASTPSISAQCWGSMLHGVTPEFHCLTNDWVASGEYDPESRYPSIFRVVREADPDAALASFCNWNAINIGIIEDNLGVTKGNDDDASLTQMILDYLDENSPKLMFVQFDEADAAGHSYGYGMPEHLEKISAADGYIKRIYDKYAEKGILENTLFIVTADHGGTGKNHGGSASIEMNVMFAAVGKTVIADGEPKNMQMRDVASVVAYALGLEQPVTWTSMVPSGLFEGVEAGERPVYEFNDEIERTKIELDTTDLYADDGTDTYDRVILIGVDGGGAFFKYADTPYLDAIFENGAVTYTMQAADPSMSSECWGSMLHGVKPEFHGLTNDITGATPYDPDSAYPSIFRVIREAEPDAEIASFSHWESMNIGIVEDGYGIIKESVSGDGNLTDKIVSYLEENDPRFLFIQLDDCDGIGHGNGYGSEDFYEQLELTDGYIGKIYNKLLEKGLLKNTLFIVTADHGGTPDGSHGFTSEAEMNIMFAVAGKTVKAGGVPMSMDEEGNVEDMQIRDTAAIVLHALGIEQPESWNSVVPGDLFENVEASARPESVVEYEVPAHRTHESSPTPAVGSGSYITDILGENRVISYLTLDGSITDSMGKAVNSDGELSFVDGYYGNGVQLDNGSIEVEGFAPGNGSFSVALWINTDGVSSDPCLIANKDWSSGANSGFLLSIRSDDDIKFNLGDGEDRMDVEYPLPADYKDGWVHVILSVDRDAGIVSFSYDFGSYIASAIPTELKDVSFDGISGLVIGQDGTRNYGASVSAVVDDVLIIDGALTQDDVAALAAYYGVEK